MDHNFEHTPLKILTNAPIGVYNQEEIYLQFVNVGTIRIILQSKQYYITGCGWKKFNNLPATVNKEWTFTKTKEALTILCNGVEVVNLVYAEQYHYCTTRWSKDVTKIYFHSHDTASVLWKPVTQGSILIESMNNK